jgi:NAD dependent epimerase/dehydratase family enzyme
MADSLLLVSQKVVPSRLVDSGYRFQQPDLAEALAAALQK